MCGLGCGRLLSVLPNLLIGRSAGSICSCEGGIQFVDVCVYLYINVLRLFVLMVPLEEKYILELDGMSGFDLE